jgi:outer membrane protein TolC
MRSLSYIGRSPSVSAHFKLIVALLICIIPLFGCFRAVDAVLPAQSSQTLPVAAEGPAAAGIEYGLAECLGLSDQNHPRIAAQRATLAAAEDALRALDSLHVPTLVVPDLPIRRRQAGLGVTAAAAALDHAQRETAYAVTRTYLAVLYARDQEEVARAIVDRLSATRDAAQKSLDGGARDVTAVDVKRATVYLRLAESRRVQASQGVKRALAALKETMGLGAQATLMVRAGGLPEVDARPSQQEIVAAALDRRAEIIRANIFAEVACLEVEAQRTSHHKQKETFATGSDVHATQVPQTVHNDQYRPGGIPPEMPTRLAGSRSERVKRAQSYYERALATVAETRNLVGLEAEDAFLRWEEASLQARAAREAADTGDSMGKELNKDFTAGLKVKVEDVVNAWVLASQARTQYNEALYKQLLALADLERITVGSFNARLAERIASRAPKEETKKKYGNTKQR